MNVLISCANADGSSKIVVYLPNAFMRGIPSARITEDQTGHTWTIEVYHTTCPRL